MNDFETLGVSVGFTLGDVVGGLIDGITLGTWVGLTLGNVVRVIYRVGLAVGFTLGDDAEVKFLWGDDGGTVADGDGDGCLGRPIDLFNIWEI